VQVPAPPTIADSPQEVKLPPKYSNREIIDATPDYLMALFDQHTSIQAQRLIEPYIGKWMRVSGKLGNVSNNEYFAQVVFEHRPSSYPRIYMLFRQPNRSDRFSVLRRGTQLTVLGQIQEVAQLTLQLDNCELI